ncbi:MAG: ABC transporter ATP-binding protein, partial [Ruminiclostridium sp.]
WRNLVIGNARKLECTLREDLYKHLQTLSPEFYSKRKTGDLIAYGINDILAIRMALGPATALSINGIVICGSSIYFMLVSIDLRLTLLTLAPIPVIIIFMALIGKKIHKCFLKVQELFGEISDRVQENINGIRVIKSYAQEDKEIENFKALGDGMLAANIEMVKVSSLLTPIIEGCFSISFVLNLVLGGKMVLSGSISLGDFVAFNTYLAMIMAPIISIGRVVNIFQRGTASLQRLNEIFSIKPKVVDGQKGISKNIKGNIEFRNLTFYYPGTTIPALLNINLNIEKGKTIGIIGKTGSGKTTLANLLLKLYNSTPGQLFLDSIDINDYSLDAIRNSFSFVPQDTFLFSASIKENIISFKNIYSEDDIASASRFSGIYESITEFPDGFDTILGERGVNLSGGQKQRISIARAIIKDPSILILDDALSAVDTVTEAYILKNFETHRKGKTTFIISHRISAVSNADEIIVMNHGSIQESGTHNELISKGGLYYEIYNEQNKEKEKNR